MKYLSRWERRKAVPYFEKVLKLDNDDTFGFAETAKCHIAINGAREYDNVQLLEKFIEESENMELMEQGYSNLIGVYEKRKENKNVIRIYESKISRFPEDANTMNGYAWFIYEERIEKKYDRGIKLAKKAVEIRPDAANIWDTLGWLYYESEKIDKAIEAMEKAVELAPEVEDFKKNLVKFKQSASTRTAA